MTEMERIVDQYDRAMNGDAWHGDPVWKILDGIRFEIAFERPAPAAHTIWELVGHITFWETEVYRRLNNLAARPVEELNFPAMPEATKENWSNALESLRKSNEAFRATLSQLDPAQLDQPLPGRDKTAYIEIHGVIQHNLYHAGQIAILRRILSENTVLASL
jgi:uncharacterized damage-inducible protein DinB